jgi:hypothetical protein
VPSCHAQGVALSEEQHIAFQERYRAARVAAGLSPLISDEHELRTFAAVMASARRRAARQRRSERPARP